MKRNYIILGISLVFLGACSHASDKIFLTTSRGQIPIQVEVADTDRERARGLMSREKLEEGRGMLFVFEEELPRGFWMKNTLIPLDIIFFDSSKKVVSFIEKMEPCKEDPCFLYDSEKPAMYALELPAGMVEKYGIGMGDKMTNF